MGTKMSFGNGGCDRNLVWPNELQVVWVGGAWWGFWPWRGQKRGKRAKKGGRALTLATFRWPSSPTVWNGNWTSQWFDESIYTKEFWNGKLSKDKKPIPSWSKNYLGGTVRWSLLPTTQTYPIQSTYSTTVHIQLRWHFHQTHTLSYIVLLCTQVCLLSVPAAKFFLRHMFNLKSKESEKDRAARQNLKRIEGWQQCLFSLTRSFSMSGTPPSFLGRGRKWSGWRQLSIWETRTAVRSKASIRNGRIGLKDSNGNNIDCQHGLSFGDCCQKKGEVRGIGLQR